MILQALNEYYGRLRDDPQIDIPEPGFSRQAIHFCLILDIEGKLVDEPLDLRHGNTAKNLVVPQAAKRSSGIAANFLWDNTGYVLGADSKGRSKRTLSAFEAFKALQHEIGDEVQDEAIQAVLTFLEAWKPQEAAHFSLWDEMCDRNIVFKLDGDLSFVHERPAVKRAWLRHSQAKASDTRGMCLVTGDTDAPISRLHAAVKGVPGTQTSGAALISFNLPSFTSYGKSQNLNAPVGELAAFAYTTALNQLLSRNSRQKVRVGDVTNVFWTEKPSRVEGLLAGLFDPGLLEAMPDQLQNDLRIFLESVNKGNFPREFDVPHNRFYILGLSPNAARISVRFWHVSTVEEISAHIGQHYRNLAIVKNYYGDPDMPSLWQLLRETAAQRDSRNISPVLSGQMMRALLTGTAYPQTILTAILNRIRADQQINYHRAAMLKAYLIRNHEMEATMSLDTTSTDPGYLLGRLFAVLEKAQEEAIKGVSATIKDRFFGAASATPGRVFPILLRGAQNNIAKLRKCTDTRGRAIHFDKLISQIVDGINAFQPTLRLEEQGMFTIGYYHQRKDLFTKKTTTQSEEE
jgi:CRISPR-associated protein Csd1